MAILILGIVFHAASLTALQAGLRWGLRVVSSDAPMRLDPAAWGSDHVGKPMPEYVTGDECLFCHRDIGPTWGENRHQLTIRAIDDHSPALTALKQSSAKDLVDEIQFILGGDHYQRFLKRTEDYGKVALLSEAWTPPREGKPGKIISTKHPHWDVKKFGHSCAGCHSTGVNPKTQAFSALSLDCFVCHGNVNPEHTKKPELVHLAKKRNDPARVVTSICAQCHVRTGTSKSTGLPYPNNFVAGDNLFRDFQVDFSDEKLKTLSDADRHVLENVRDVVVLGKEEVTCLSCHDVHAGSSKKHHRVARSDYCLNCHHAQGPKRNLKPFTVHSKTCGY